MCWTFDIKFFCGHQAPKQGLRICAAFRQKHILAKTADPRYTEILSENDERCTSASGDTRVLSREKCRECKSLEERTEFLEQQKAAHVAEQEKALAEQNEKYLLRRLKVNLMRLEVTKDDSSMTAEEKEKLEKEYQAEKTAYEAEREGIMLIRHGKKLEQMVIRKKEKLRQRQETLKLEAKAKGWEDASDAVSGVGSRTEREEEEEDDEGEYPLDVLEEYFEELRISEKVSLDTFHETGGLEVREGIGQVPSPSLGWKAASTSSSP